MRSPSRKTTVRISWILDNLLPPVLRDSRWLMSIPLRAMAGRKADLFLEFKDRAPSMSPDEFADVYGQLDGVAMQRETDLNDECLERILLDVTSESILEVGCGRGLLAGRLSELAPVTATDIALPEDLPTRFPNVCFKVANVEALPFEDRSFHTVVTTHTLEHVQNLHDAITELRRVARRRLIVVVPKQRPYRYTFDLHLHFFPYEHSLLTVMGTDRRNRCTTVAGDLYYVEDFD